MSIIMINSPDQLATLALDLELRPDWHEPDEQDVSARVVGSKLDNAFGPSGGGGELVVDIMQDGAVIARANLADLLAWACQPKYKAAASARGLHVDGEGNVTNIREET